MPLVIVPIVAVVSGVAGFFAAGSVKGILWLIALAFAASLIIGVL